MSAPVDAALVHVASPHCYHYLRPCEIYRAMCTRSHHCAFSWRIASRSGPQNDGYNGYTNLRRAAPYGPPTRVVMHRCTSYAAPLLAACYVPAMQSFAIEAKHGIFFRACSIQVRAVNVRACSCGPGARCEPALLSLSAPLRDLQSDVHAVSSLCFLMANCLQKWTSK